MRQTRFLRFLTTFCLTAILIPPAVAADAPATAANLPAPQVEGKPTFSTEKITAIKIKKGPAGCVLRYTLDGRTPSGRNSAAYYKELRVVAPFTLTAAWYTSDGQHGELLKLTSNTPELTTATVSKNPVIAINIDPSEDPSLAPMLEKMQAACEEAYPRLVALMDANTPALRHNAIFRIQKDYKGVAATGGSRVMFAPAYYHKRPNDIGSAVHEMVHIIQGYHGRNPGWLVEGLADAVRWWHWEPAAKQPKIDAAKHKYTDSYQVTGSFLAWVEAKKDPKIIARLNTVMRNSAYKPELFKEWTGKDLDGLWEEYKSSQAAKGA